MQLFVDIQNTLNHSSIPSALEFQQWVESALTAAGYQAESAEVTIRIVNQDESQALNNEYRQKDKPTNVLSFPFEAPPGVPCDLLGDLVICHQVVENEAAAQAKSNNAHWAHMVVHGTLHLLGFDHIEPADAEDMEALEVKILEQFHINNPYEIL